MTAVCEPEQAGEVDPAVRTTVAGFLVGSWAVLFSRLFTLQDLAAVVEAWGYVGPGTLLVDERSDPVVIVATIRQHHCSWAQSGQKHWTEPIVMSLTGSEAEAHG